ncbi:hypothetical protein RND61_24745 [Streptomyces sp. TRM76323]|uniref:3-keto-disaccharide hydrolase domain-containing protein n=1 Tax=Streptomyces tamarix TaxID=3078565 RepID=A0ABU3QR42_9ACTN|nr:hypothetical protein [Streptomyces tamarix]MDT9685245.1 hypothetical protein [Streptomyces tamarix]
MTRRVRPSLPPAATAPLARRAVLAAALTATACGTAAPAAATPLPAPPGDGPWPDPAGPGGDAFTADFPTDGLVTNEYAHRHPADPASRTHPDWTVTSGSLFGRWTFGWTGVPDDTSPGPDSATGTGSCVFRLATRRRDFADTWMRLRALVEPPVTTARTPARDWDGAHLWLRYHGPQELYALSFRRRDGTVAVKRKAPPPHDPAGEGVYTTLASVPHPLEYGRWHRVAGLVRDTADGGVHISLHLNGLHVIDVEDPAPGRLREAGGIGLRADNTSLVFDALTAYHPARPPAAGGPDTTEPDRREGP